MKNMIEKALNIVYESILSDESILLILRERKGLDEQQFKNLKNAIDVQWKYFYNKEFIPKKLALCFVDIGNYFYFNDGWYQENERARIEETAHEIVFLAKLRFMQMRNYFRNYFSFPI